MASHSWNLDEADCVDKACNESNAQLFDDPYHCLRPILGHGRVGSKTNQIKVGNPKRL